MGTSPRIGRNQRLKRSIRTVSPAWLTSPSRSSVRTIATVSRTRSSGLEYSTPCSGPTWTRWLDPSPSTNRPPERSSTVAADIAMVGAVRTNTLLMAVPRRMRRVRSAQAARIAN